MTEPSQRPSMTTGVLERLRGDDPGRWPNIRAAETLSLSKMARLREVAGDLLPPDEGALVVFGSLARREFTQDSDLDWAVIIDGRADSSHLDIIHSLKPLLSEAGFGKPGPTEVFGGLIFSHDLVHSIGGDEDTNKNMTRRLLLLLESKSVEIPGSTQTYHRLKKGILDRYVQEDASFTLSNQAPDKIPRFLLNDIVRYWRTLAVDYVNKYRTRAGEKWALRNIKLRMSRKLIFTSGLLMCVTWALKDRPAEGLHSLRSKLVTYLREWTDRSPLESLALVIEQYAPAEVSNVFNEYDAFLLLLNDDHKRKILEQLSPEDAYENEIFLEARKMAVRFDATLTRILFSSDVRIAKLIQKYGVF